MAVIDDPDIPHYFVVYTFRSQVPFAIFMCILVAAVYNIMHEVILKILINPWKVV